MISRDNQEMLRAFESSCDLADLEVEMRKFNPFFALRIANRETLHSAFLRWLLDPSESHGSGDSFLKAFLLGVLSENPLQTENLTAANSVADWDMKSAIAKAEWEKIDILIRDDKNRFICAIENKWLSGEHGKQLENYRNVVSAVFGGYQLLHVYLTRSRTESSDKHYCNISYMDLLKWFEPVLESLRREKLPSEGFTFIDHYMQAVRRSMGWIGDGEIHRRILKDHYPALSELRHYQENRPKEIMEVIRGYLEERSSTCSDVIVDLCTSTIAEDITECKVRFIPRGMDCCPKVANKDTFERRIVFWEFVSTGRQAIHAELYLKLFLAPGQELFRTKLLNAVCKSKGVFTLKEAPQKQVGWLELIHRQLLGTKEYYSITNEELRIRTVEWIDNLVSTTPDVTEVICKAISPLSE